MLVGSVGSPDQSVPFWGKKYNQLSKRMKSQKDLIDITLKLLVIICNVLNTSQPF
jgi:hypothetical protein